jgi:hypothetical protein
LEKSFGILIIYSQWLLHARKYVDSQIVTTDRLDPQNNKNEWKRKAQVQQEFDAFSTLAVPEKLKN